MEKSRLFKFRYKLNSNHLEATSIEESACQYKWDCGSIPMELRECFQDSIYPGTGNLRDTMAILKALSKALRGSLHEGDSERHLKACWAVLYWGGVASAGNLEFYALQHFVRNESSGVSDLLSYHHAAHDSGGWFDPIATTSLKLQGKVQRMTAGVTKIHSLIDSGLLIYDSRVACALAWLVERYCDSVNDSDPGTASIPGSLVFCLPAERTGKAVRDPEKVRSSNKSTLNNPATYVSPGYTLAGRNLWTIDMWRASRTLTEILKRLDHMDEKESVCEDYFLKYQLGLFMIGYHLGAHRVVG
jgi:hypothetical protein